jgi:NTE family protein
VFVLSGGAVRGAAQVGMLRALLERGITPDEVVGVSAGALNGLALAVTPTLDRMDSLEAIWRDTAERPPIRGNVVRTVSSIVRGKPSFDNGERLRELVAEHAPVEDISDTVVPFHLGTTAASTGRQVWWRAGSAVDLLCASAAVPGVLPAVELADGDLHLDGGVVSNVPLRYAVGLDPTRIVVCDVAARFLPAEKQTALTLMLTGFRAAAAELTRQEWADVPADIEVIHLELPVDSTGLDIDFTEAASLIDEGYAAAVSVLGSP